MATEEPERGLTTLARLQKFAEEIGTTGDLTLRWIPEHEEWMVAAEWGQEAPGSPMIGAAAYGSASEVTECIEQALTSARYGPDTPPGGAKLKSREEILLRLDEMITGCAQVRVNRDGPGLTPSTSEAALQRFRSDVLGEPLDVTDFTPTEDADYFNAPSS